MQYIIIVVIVLLALFIVGLVIRRKHNVVIQRLEQEKMQIQHYPIFEELTKVKSLNMNGQTEEMFEHWRNIWTEVIDVHVIKIDSMLFDAEEYIDRFKFKKASNVEQAIEEYIAKCEKSKNQIISELDELIGSEEKNRIEIEQIKEHYRSARKTLLAHQYSFGPALSALEKRVEQFVPKFEEFDELTVDGNYLQAREIVLALNSESQTIYHLLSEVPTLLSEIQTKIPAAIHELRNGQREMEEQSYYLNHLELTKYLDNLEEELETLKSKLAELDVESVAPRLNEIIDEIENYYDLLEKEVIARSYVDKNCDDTFETLTEVVKVTKEISNEAVYVQSSYHLPENEAEIPKAGLKQLELIQKRFELLVTRVRDEKSAYSSLQEELVEISEQIDRIKDEQEQFSSRLKNLRIDENKARAKLDSLKRILQETDRQLNKANIPGIPEEMDARIEEAEEQIYIVIQSLQDIPLNMNRVQSNIENAEKCIQEVSKHAHEMIENVMLIERIIQYGNRYRGTNPKVNDLLLESEHAFHQYRYIKALEDAAAAVEMAEPGAIKRIEELVQDELYEKSQY
ncbi:septation ring formation regulator EzrA [Ureibacillus chungkukjangi]|uniref:Septation ring formation regulator EzrA n=1 Tax=Ureibacillus chungkukjangi TaxID=1202712 RepID=A0A318TWK2_9BACL|nr:septation ring formation regulator EzrA [Ureibacillus chungkukjangi]MCM3387456.1 septation ring formation regulator EzrA [Ureibacillus chungkukjangi]PYF09062.1 septation ring formation regulator [Ureibacillus chungkukjangi]